jgi:hypothetical protein
MSGLTKNAKRLQKKRIKHIPTCTREVIQGLQLTSTWKKDEKRNKYIRRRRRKKKYENNQIEKLEELGQQNQIRHFYRDINKLREDFKPRLTICKKRRHYYGKRWKDHFHELLNSMGQEQEPNTMQDHNDNNEEESLPTI